MAVLNFIIVWLPFFGLYFALKNPLQLIAPQVCWSLLYLLTISLDSFLARKIEALSEQTLFLITNISFGLLLFLSLFFLKVACARTWRDILVAPLSNGYTWIQIWWVLGMTFQNKFR